VWYKVRVMTEQHVASGIPQEEEPKTPMWLTAVGAALFVGVALWWAVTPSAPSTPVEAAPSASAPAAAAAPNPQAQAVPPPAQPLQQAAPPASAQARIPVPSALPAEAQKLRGKPHP
jgi:hypothetical protein